MLKKKDPADCPVLFELMQDPAVRPYVRDCPDTLEACRVLTTKAIDSERLGQLISRTITDEAGTPIGEITLYDLEADSGFLRTWIGKPYFGKGYNRRAKHAFFSELFLKKGIETVFMKIRTTNGRSLRATEKLPYAFPGQRLYPAVYKKMNQDGTIYRLYVVTKSSFLTAESAMPVHRGTASRSGSASSDERRADLK